MASFRDEAGKCRVRINNSPRVSIIHGLFMPDKENPGSSGTARLNIKNHYPKCPNYPR